MALITCSNCGKQISDKAKFCPQCGQVALLPQPSAKEAPSRFCTECGISFQPGQDSCPNCGCPAPVPEESFPSSKEDPGSSLNAAKRKKFIIICVAIALAVIIALYVGLHIHAKQQAEAALALEQYESAFDQAAFLMYAGALDAEETGNLIKRVWYNSIFEESDPTTDAYTRPNGYYVDDFNEALTNLFSDEEFIEKIDTMERRQQTVANYMKNLTDPPEGYEDAYQALKDFYGAYTTLTNMATNPTGSLQTFSESFNEADSDAADYYEALKLYLED